MFKNIPKKKAPRSSHLFTMDTMGHNSHHWNGAERTSIDLIIADTQHIAWRIALGFLIVGSDRIEDFEMQEDRWPLVVYDETVPFCRTL